MSAMQLSYNKESSLIIIVNNICQRFQVIPALFKEINFYIQNND